MVTRTKENGEKMRQSNKKQKKIEQPRNTYVIPADIFKTDIFGGTPVNAEDGERFKCKCPCEHEFYRFKDINHVHTLNKNGRILHTIAYNTGEISGEGKEVYMFMMWEVIKLISEEYLVVDNIDIGTGMSWSVCQGIKPVTINVSALAQDLNKIR